jgi:alpha-1,3-fucosyltransferase
MTYRWDSDVVAPYGYVRPIASIPLHPSEDQIKVYLSNNHSKVNYAKGKTKMAVWFVSNCEMVVSSRNELVKELQKYITIDVYGTCGNMTCPKKNDESYESSEECRDLAAAKHKFYLSLENSLCRDYVTEKYNYDA